MRTLLVSPELFRAEGGIARILRLYLRALAELAGPGGATGSLVLNDDDGRDPRLALYGGDAVGEVLGCARRKGLFIRRLLGAARRYDCIVCGHLHQLPAVWAARRLRPSLRYYLVAHGIEVWRPYTALERRALRGAERILCVSEFTRSQLRRFAPDLDPARLDVVPNALDPGLAVPPEAPPFIPGQPRLLCVTRLTRADAYKGVDTLLEALPEIRRQCPDVRLRLAGTGDDQGRLEALAHRLGLGAAAAFLGGISDAQLRTEYQACDLFVLPSRREGFGLVYLEAMSHGKACLAARAGAAPELVTPDTGALAEYGNIPDIATAVLDLVRHPRDPAVVRQRAEQFSYAALRERLAAILTA